uniref:glutathione transferase n=2 Tax=Petromyzon marinus TaxID=7757 RepID=S4RK12_PETMA
AMGLEVYFDLSAAPCRPVLLLLKKCGIEFTAHAKRLEKGENQTEEFGKVTPLKLVPVIVDNGFRLTESVAISKYLACRYGLADHWYPADLQRRARVDEYLAWQHTSIRPPCSMLLVLEGVLPGLTGQPVQEQKIADIMKGLELCLEHLEAYYLQDDAFLCGDQISIADLFAYSDLMQPMGAGHDVLKDRHKLLAWRQRVETFMGKEVLEEVNRKILNSHSALLDMEPAEKEGLAQYLFSKLKMTG